MCGRFALSTSAGELLVEFGLSGAYQAAPPAPSLVEGRFNVAPGQPVVAARVAEAARELTALRWGLIPAWAGDPTIGNRLINARAETVAEKPAFRKAFEQRRCLVPMTAFYEWRRGGERGGEPWAFFRADGGLLAVAGLWERWVGLDGTELETCALLTTTPNELVARVHDRMPVIVTRADHERWLDPDARGGALAGLLVPYPADRMRARRVSPRVGNVAHDDPGLLDPLPVEPELELG
jgi:putative SOS response-associated peptidase YedK